MYNTSGVDAIATITELRSKTSELIEYVREHRKGVLVQKNNEPYAVLLDWETYQRMSGEGDLGEGDRPPKKRTRQKKSSGGGKESASK